MSLLTGAPRTAAVVALCACVLCEVPHGVMAAMWADRPELAALLSTVAPFKRASMPKSIAERIRRFLPR